MTWMIDAAKDAESKGLKWKHLSSFTYYKLVLTHLDKCKDVKELRKTKQCLKHRFWTEIRDRAKLFCLSGFIDGRCAKHEFHYLARFVSVMQCHPLSWRAAHLYVLVNRFEDLAKECTWTKRQNIILYGYV